MSLWAIAAAPLIAGNDVRAMADSSREASIARDVLLNRDVIAVNQDSLGVQGHMVSNARSELQVWAKPLKDGSMAVVLLNRAAVPARISASFERLGIPGASRRVRDLWAHSDTTVTGESYAANVAPHGVVMFRAWPAAK